VGVDCHCRGGYHLFQLKVWKLITAKKNEAEPEDDY